jgi:hypothetical protein
VITSALNVLQIQQIVFHAVVSIEIFLIIVNAIHISLKTPKINQNVLNVTINVDNALKLPPIVFHVLIPIEISLIPVFAILILHKMKPIKQNVINAFLQKLHIKNK